MWGSSSRGSGGSSERPGAWPSFPAIAARNLYHKPLMFILFSFCFTAIFTVEYTIYFPLSFPARPCVFPKNGHPAAMHPRVQRPSDRAAFCPDNRILDRPPGCVRPLPWRNACSRRRRPKPSSSRAWRKSLLKLYQSFAPTLHGSARLRKKT